MGTVKSGRLELPARGVAAKMSTVLAVGLAAGVALAATPALSQGAMGPGAGAPMAPQPRVAPAAPVVTPPIVTPQVPIVPQVPMAAPNPVTPAPAPQQNKAFSIRGNEQQAIASAPKALSPANGATVGGPDPNTPIAFRWTPLIPRPQEPVTYRLRVWQLMQGQNGTQAMATNQPVMTKDVDNIPQESIAPPGCSQNTCSFVWSVQALNRDGKPIGENNGTSDPFGFKTAGVAGGTTATPGTSQPAGITGTTMVVAILALQTNNNSTSIFDRWGNLFAEKPGNRAAPNLSIVSTDRSRGSVAQTNTDQKGQFKIPSTPGVHEVTLPGKDIEAAYARIVELVGNESPEPQALHGAGWLVALIAIKVPGTATGGGRQDFGLARAIPRGASSLQVKLAVNNDGTVSTVDWNDGAGPQPVTREGKALGPSSGPGEIVGRTLFVGEAPKKQ